MIVLAAVIWIAIAGIGMALCHAASWPTPDVDAADAMRDGWMPK